MNKDILTACGLRIAGRIPPNAQNPLCGDVWRAKDGRLIVVDIVDGGFVSLYINGKQELIGGKFLPFFLLSLEAEPMNRVEFGKM